MQFDPQKYGAAVSDLLADAPLSALGPGAPVSEKRDALNNLDEIKVVAGHAVADRDTARCCLSGLWLLYDYLDESHTISQEIHTATGSYWHGIMHRREPDYSNGKYWFRKVGNHPVFEPLCREAGELAGSEELDGPSKFLAQQSTWDPFQFIDLCECVARGRSSAESLCKRIAQIEWQLLFDFCYQRAIGA
jgi:hypothetical protein